MQNLMYSPSTASPTISPVKTSREDNSAGTRAPKGNLPWLTTIVNFWKYCFEDMNHLLISLSIIITLLILLSAVVALVTWFVRRRRKDRVGIINSFREVNHHHNTSWADVPSTSRDASSSSNVSQRIVSPPLNHKVGKNSHQHQPLKGPIVANQQPARVFTVANQQPAKVPTVANQQPTKVPSVANQQPSDGLKTAKQPKPIEPFTLQLRRASKH